MQWYLVNLPSTLFYCFKMEAARSVDFDRTSYPPLILAFCSSVHIYYPSFIDTNAYVVYLLACEYFGWVLTIALLPPFPLSIPSCCEQMMESRRQRIPRMILHGVRLRGVVTRSQEGGLAFSIVATFVLAFLRRTCLTYACTQNLLLLLTRLWSSLCIWALETPGL